MYELKSRVRFSETDENGILSVTGVMNYLQDCCTMQAEDLDIGLPYLRENHLGWVVTSYQIKLLRKMPVIGEEIIVKTWPYQFRGMLGYRNFTIENAQGERLLEADSLWVLMNLQAMKPTRLPEKMQEAYQMSPKLGGEWNTRKKLTFLKTGGPADTFFVPRAYLDTNGHMNNVKYIESAVACLPQETDIAEMFIAYKKSAMAGDRVLTYVSEKENGYMISLQDEDGEEFCTLECLVHKDNG